MNVLIVDDIRLARSELKDLLQDHKSLTIIGEAENANQALDFINTHKPDLIFLDINMPGMTGLEMLEHVDYNPKVIFTTAHEEYALKSFKFNTVDYLLKPITEEKLSNAIEKIYWDAPVTLANQEKDELENQDKTKENVFTENSKVLVKTPQKCMLINLNEILRFESDGNYTQVITANDKASIHRALTKIEVRLPESIFFRANRQQIINLNFAVNIDPIEDRNSYRITMSDNTIIEVARRQSSKMRSLLGL